MPTEKAFGIPYPKNRCFTGREKILSDIGALLVPQSRLPEEETSTPVQCSTAICVVHGLPGIGKTNLAIEFGYQHKHIFSHIFWVSSDSEEKFNDGFFKIAQSLGLVSNDVMEDKEVIVNTALGWLKTADPRLRWLLILDNVDNTQILNPLWSDLHHGSVLITSRDPIPWVEEVTHSSRNFRLLHLSPHDSAKLIQGKLEKKLKGGIDYSSAADLAKRFGYYPLYMDQMTSFIESSTLTLAEFYEQLESEPSDDELQDFRFDNAWYTSSVAKAIESHMAKLSSFDFEARNILSVIAFFDPDSIPERLLLSTDRQIACLSSTVRRQKVLSTLIRPSFIYLNSGGPGQERCVSLHRLVRDAALRSESAPQRAFDTAVALLRNSFPLHRMSRDHMVEDWAECEIFQPHVLSLHHHYLDIRDRGVVTPTFDFIELIYSCAWYLCERGRFALSKTLICSIYNDYISLRGVASAAPAEFLADIYTVQLFYHNEADHGVSLIELATRAMDIREDAVKKGDMDEDHPNRANGPMNVGVVLALKNPQMAIDMHSRALEIRLRSEKYKLEQIHGLALNYLNIGRCWWVVGELEKAASCFEESLGLWKKRETQVGKKFSLTALALLSLGIVRADQNDFEKAMQLISESLELHIQTMGQCHRKTLVCYYRLGWLCHQIGENYRAEQLLTICLDAYSASANLHKAELARTKFQLSKVMKKNGASEEEYLALDRESRLMLSEVLQNKGVVNIQGTRFVDADFDNEVDYYFR
ncbi:P-loop containing nucleoside triphosphate hydrolase protein [Xylaria acuta]|nr:P-loop containing nucleoside triphosphate hydrolase protein [Xylaria acuta]